ncbi:hypothetical protein MFLAVUS_006653 [Mucor flavus]|uniref:Uncharacterized protein n=1 Tax=Mucor flavus TaxID=439312 RepID=A0ABP9Z248_9FUNG
MFDGTIDTLGELQVRTGALINATEEEKKKIHPGCSEKSIKEVAWMVTPPSSTMEGICEENISSSVAPPQCITNTVRDKVEETTAVSVFREVTFSPVEGEKAGTIVPKIIKTIQLI